MSENCWHPHASLAGVSPAGVSDLGFGHSVLSRGLRLLHRRSPLLTCDLGGVRGGGHGGWWGDPGEGVQVVGIHGRDEGGRLSTQSIGGILTEQRDGGLLSGEQAGGQVGGLGVGAPG